MPAFARWILLPAGLAIAALALAADNAIDAGHSTIVATFRQMNVPLDAAFGRFSGTIVYEATHPAAASAAVEVEVGSLDLGDESYNAEVRKAAWFDSAHFPQSSFRSSAIKPGGADHFEATGTLSIKGKSQTITVPIAVQHTAHATAFDGSFELSRKDFGVGDPDWDGVLDDKVRVHFHLQLSGATAAAPAQTSRS
ncbi:MAG TPA: YceI family protein [Steroidobacteraceae bacterium]|nr:YceI family protein [Steroidobacteraceae bacterium]